MGEGYHNFHHTFPSDYRNGVQIHQFDPTKWLLAGLSVIGVTRNLRRVPRRRILQATLEMEQKRLEKRFRGELPAAMRDRLESVRLMLNERLDRFHALMARRDQIKADASRQSQRVMRTIRAEIRIARREVRRAVDLWKHTARLTSSLATQ
jgi:stearoyl-CoA desaturase (delta-9 desaturase)